MKNVFKLRTKKGEMKAIAIQAIIMCRPFAWMRNTNIWNNFPNSLPNGHWEYGIVVT